MSGKEIKVSTYTLAESNGNMKRLMGNVCEMPTISGDVIVKSKGCSADSVRDCIDSSRLVKDELTNLIERTVEYLESAGVVFKDTDQSVGKTIEKC